MTQIKRVLLRDHVAVCGVAGEDINADKVKGLSMDFQDRALLVQREGFEPAIIPEGNIKALWPVAKKAK